MAFDNVTFFEVNLPDQAFASSRGDRSKPSTDESSTDQAKGTSGESGGGGSKGKLLLVALVLGGVALAVRRFRGGGDEDEEIEMAYEEPGVEVEASES